MMHSLGALRCTSVHSDPWIETVENLHNFIRFNSASIHSECGLTVFGRLRLEINETGKWLGEFFPCFMVMLGAVSIIFQWLSKSRWWIKCYLFTHSWFRRNSHSLRTWAQTRHKRRLIDEMRLMAVEVDGGRIFAWFFFRDWKFGLGFELRWSIEMNAQMMYDSRQMKRNKIDAEWANFDETKCHNISFAAIGEKWFLKRLEKSKMKYIHWLSSLDI